MANYAISQVMNPKSWTADAVIVARWWWYHKWQVRKDRNYQWNHHLLIWNVFFTFWVAKQEQKQLFAATTMAELSSEDVGEWKQSNKNLQPKFRTEMVKLEFKMKSKNQSHQIYLILLWPKATYPRKIHHAMPQARSTSEMSYNISQTA